MTWTLLDILALVAAGFAGGAINAAAGGGSLITFPVMVAIGIPPLTANLTNTISMTPGYAGAVSGYRPELVGQGPRLRRLIPFMLVGAAIGVLLLQIGSDETFDAVVPVLIVIACGLLAVQPRLKAKLAARQEAGHRHPTGVLEVAILLAGVYSAYFGAAVGVMLLAVLAILVDDQLQRLNACNRALTLCASLLAATAFAILGPVDWVAVAILAPCTLLGGRLGVGVARKLSDQVLRLTVIGFGLAIAAYIAFG